MGRNGLNRFMTPQERFMARVEVEGECWLWIGALRNHRYAALMVDGKPIMAHRWSYENFVGPIPEGKQIDHICGVTRCVAPHHLRPMEAYENVRAHWREQRGVCRNGHEMTPENVVWRRGGKVRLCRVCSRARLARYRAKRKL